MLSIASDNLPPCDDEVAQWLGDGSNRLIPVELGVSTAHERALKAHEHLFLSGAPRTHIYQVLDGVVGSYKLLGDGRRQIVGFYYPGDLIGIETTTSWEHYGEALCEARVRCISVDTIDRLIQSEPGFGQTLVATLASDLAETREQLLSLGRKSAIEKLATFLLRISRRNCREGEDEYRLYLPMTRMEIADYLGLTVETVSRNFTRLKKEKIIAPVSRCEVEIVDLNRLRELAEGDGAA
jgi:CRP/FNR family transcriptional regulator